MLLSLGRGLAPAAGPAPLPADGLLTESGRPMGTESGARLRREARIALAGGQPLELLTEDHRHLEVQVAAPFPPGLAPPALATAAGEDLTCEDLTLLTVETP